MGADRSCDFSSIVYSRKGKSKFDSSRLVAAYSCLRQRKNSDSVLATPGSKIWAVGAAVRTVRMAVRFLSSLFCTRTTPFFSYSLPFFPGTFVLIFPRSVVLPSGYVFTIGLVGALGVHSSRIDNADFPERWFPLGDPARSDDEKTPNRKFPKAAVSADGTPWQPPL